MLGQMRARRLCIGADMPPTVCSSTVWPQLPPVASAPLQLPPWTTSRRLPPRTCLPCPVNRHPAGQSPWHRISCSALAVSACFLQPELQVAMHGISSRRTGTNCMASANHSQQPHIARGARKRHPRLVRAAHTISATTNVLGRVALQWAGRGQERPATAGTLRSTTSAENRPPPGCVMSRRR